jgi:hypothetical protein
MSVDRAKQYHLEAQKCPDLVELISDDGIRTQLRKTADEWLAMAARATPKEYGLT